MQIAIIALTVALVGLIFVTIDTHSRNAANDSAQERPSDIQAACARHRGIQQIGDTSAKPFTVVCKDGHAVWVK